jgi:dTDP-4-dehydrorhamnose reductase
MTARGYTRAIFSGLTTLEMARLCRRLLEDPARPTGLWQVASEPIDKFSLLTLVNDALDLRIALASDPHFFLDRSLDGAAFTERTGYRTPSWPNMVSAFAKDVEAHASLYRASL